MPLPDIRYRIEDDIDRPQPPSRCSGILTDRLSNIQHNGAAASTTA